MTLSSSAADPSRLDRPGREHLFVALSGGVDSAVALLRLKRAGHRVSALFMKNWEEDDDEYCAAAEDLQDAQQVCAALDVTLHTVNLSYEYWDRVFDRFLREYRAGRTPNPDVVCNREVKFEVFVEHALDLGATRVATGHYARVAEATSGLRLCRGADPDKDQSYFLHTLDQVRLSRAVFPLGHLCKKEVRRLARDAGLKPHDKKDSTGICFIGERPFRAFLARYVEPQPGTIRAVDGPVVGHHQGLAFYTIGQRQGLGIGGLASRNGLPWFVAAKDLAKNELLVAQGHDHPALHAGKLQAREMTWVAGTPPARRFRCEAKIRYRQPDQPCTVELDHVDGAQITFDSTQRAITPGQSVVLYERELCLGGGTIEHALQ